VKRRRRDHNKRSAESKPGHGDSPRAVIAALLANLGIAVLKFGAFLVTASSSMLSEAIHSVADTGNQLLLLLGRRRAARPPDDQHPFGYAPVRYFYSFIVAFVLFSLGGVFSIFEGVEKITHPHQVEDLWIAVVVLFGAGIMEAFSFRTARAEANVIRPAGESWWQFIRHTKSPDLPVVLLEDAAALVGLGLALIGVAAAGITDDARWDGVGSLSIGILLVLVAIVLVVEMGSLLIGESAGPDVVDRIRRVINDNERVTRLIHLRTEQLGPDEIVVAIKAEFETTMRVPELATAIDQLEVEIRTAEPRATLIFIEPDVYRDPV
jgi:cation diffusion facilitator family transporter